MNASNVSMLLSPQRPRGARMLALAICSAMLVACGKPSVTAVPPPPSVGVTTAVERKVRDVDEFTGRMEATETVTLRPRVGGYIDRIHFKSGQEVKKGDLLISIDPLIYRAEVVKAEGELAAARSRAELARLEDARGKTLVGQKAISQQEYDQLSAALTTANAAVKAAEGVLQTASLNLGYSQIRAPISGRISRAIVTEGNLVIAGATVLATIESLDQMYAYFDANEAAFLRFTKLAKAGPLQASSPVPISLGLLTDAGYPYRGVIESFDNRLNVDTGSIRTRAVFDNKERRFTPGLYARLRLMSGADVSSLLIPDRAIGQDQSKRFVMVVRDDGTAEYRVVELGALYDGMRVVRSGLKPGERVVVDGLQRVRPDVKVTPELEQLDESGRVAQPAGASGT